MSDPKGRRNAARVAVGRLHGYSSQLADGYVLEMGAGSVGDFLALVPGLG